MSELWPFGPKLGILEKASVNRLSHNTQVPSLFLRHFAQKSRGKIEIYYNRQEISRVI